MEGKKKYWTGKISQTQDIKKKYYVQSNRVNKCNKWRDSFDLECSYEKKFKINFKIFMKFLFFVSIFFN